uniref:L1 transposable element RRM domain-containing protein n=1 Tax=Myripristis murdjan TaxID=586833 RepID=A0A667WUH6_9TELE
NKSKKLRHIHSDAALAEMKTMLAELKTDFRLDLKSEMKSLRGEMKNGFERLEEKVTMLNETVQKLDSRLEAEHRIITSVDRNAVSERLLSFLLQNLEHQERRSNLRIYGVAEDTESGVMLKFIDPLIKDLLNLPLEFNLGIERAHRSLQKKPTNPTDSSRSIVVSFSSFQVKESVLHGAWKKKKIEFNRSQIFFDRDHSNALQNKKREYIEIKKQLKQKDIRFQSLYPNKLRVFLETGAVIFNSAWEAADGLSGHGINCKVS